jgi:Fic family protein/DNA-binding XRE family transcriptional regulator
MNISKKLETIQKTLGLTQTKLAGQLGVSFPTLNSWIIGKSIPRLKKEKIINDLFLEVTGQKQIPEDELNKKRKILQYKTLGYKSVLREIIDNPDIRDQFILKLTYHSNGIEGSTLTEPDTANILFNNIAISEKTLMEHMEAKNHQTALLYLFDYLLQKQKINEDLILKLHGILMNGIIPNAGVYRNHAVRIVGVNLPTSNYLSIKKNIQELIRFSDDFLSKKDFNIISFSAIFHSKFEQIHPFSDGNGRIGRLLLNAFLLKDNMAPAVIRQEKKQLYYTYLYKSQIKEEYSQFEDYLCDAIMAGFTILEREDGEWYL